MSLPLWSACTWASLLGSECNRCFSLWVVHLKGGCFNFQGLRLLLRLLLIVGLTSDTLAYLRSSDWELQFNLSVPRLPRPWVGGMYLYPLIFTLFLIQNHSLRLLGTFFSQKFISLHHYTLLKMLITEMSIGRSEVSWGSCPFGLFRMCSA